MTGVNLERDFCDFVASRQRSLVRAAWLLCGDWGVAEDIVQTALAQVWKRWYEVRSKGGAEAYVYRSVVNSWRTARRRRWWGERPHASLPDAELPQVDAEMRLVLLQVMDRLPPRQKVVLALRYLCDLDEATTAKAMGCSVGTVKSQASRAIATLRSDPMLRGAMEMEPS
jgi:RNA polymerase sigma-70 factor (sigma-E family)